MRIRVKPFARSILPKSVRRWVVRKTRRPPVGRVRLGDVRQVTPISRVWGGDRGLPVDRYYIERFLAESAADIQGRVLEVGDNTYTLQFGGNRVTQSDIVHGAPGNPKATFVADFADAPELPSDAFDCIICTQTLQLVPDISAAIYTLYRILRPGGVLLVTVPGISQIYHDAENRWNDCWRFTVFSARRLFTQAFPEPYISVQSRGNVLAAIAFLHGLAAEELTRQELDYSDDSYQLSILVRAVKPIGDH